MSPRLRKFLGMIGILAFMCAYILGVSKLGDYIPDHWAARLAFYGLAGILWGVPLFPVITWMSRER
jgi:hypothetical protein